MFVFNGHYVTLNEFIFYASCSYTTAVDFGKSGLIGIFEIYFLPAKIIKNRIIHHWSILLTLLTCNYHSFLWADCRNLLHQLIEPNPQLRIPLLEIMCHPWITKNGKCPFMPYSPPPKNKMLRNQVSVRFKFQAPANRHKWCREIPV